MARSSSRSKAAPSRPAPAPAPRSAPPPPAHRPPAPAPPAPMAAPQQSGGMLSGLGATMAQGFAFGTGSAIAREAVGSVMGAFGGKDKEAAPAPAAPVAAPPAQQQYGGSCAIDQKAFLECLQTNASNAANCDFYYNALQACQSRN